MSVKDLFPRLLQVPGKPLDVREESPHQLAGRKVALFATGDPSEWRGPDRRKGDEEYAARVVAAYNATYAVGINPKAVPDVGFLLGRLIAELPAKRDWLDPDLEKAARAALAKAKEGME